ncbi:hypothetical protein HYDPIDRAFT_116784 [Hydnomerulius pinastri MD-312]|uniref:Uncharacterized protein n=1 Tax=Hydnomerulius pinastri MD-312 TaxID=994086 RepID=A0A0C9W3I4_9AGAM|nr:hypothetical protein HYDPIDRAFT_116784 [Hydnomerulius pinastri MD-312]
MTEPAQHDAEFSIKSSSYSLPFLSHPYYRAPRSFEWRHQGTYEANHMSASSYLYALRSTLPCFNSNTCPSLLSQPMIPPPAAGTLYFITYKERYLGSSYSTPPKDPRSPREQLGHNESLEGA